MHRWLWLRARVALGLHVLAEWLISERDELLIWRGRRCSTCSQRFDSPPCEVLPIGALRGGEQSRFHRRHGRPQL